MWLAKGTMPAAFKAKPDIEESEENEASRPEAPPEAPRPPVLRLRGKQNPQTFVNAEQEFRARFLGPLRTWLVPRRFAPAAAIIRHLREMRGFPSFARSFPFYAKASNIASQFPEALHVVPGGTTRNPRIAVKDVPAPDAEQGPVVEPGAAPKARGDPREASAV